MKDIDTKILNLGGDIQNLEKWFGGRKFVLERKYRASEDGHDPQEFRGKVHLLENFIIVAEAETGQKFGGYTTVPLDKDAWTGYHRDEKAFVFSLTHQTKHPLIPGKEDSAVNHDPKSLICFGGGHDIKFAENSNITANSFTQFGHTY